MLVEFNLTLLQQQNSIISVMEAWECHMTSEYWEFMQEIE